MAKVCNVAAPITSVNGITINRTKPANYTNYENRSSRTVELLVYHYTGNYEDSASGNANYFMGANRDASAHYFVDDDSIYQSVDVNDIAWHCSLKNSNSIGIEMCCTAGNYRIGEKAQANAIALGIELCKYLGITAETVDTYVIRHYDVTGKNCPAQFAGSNNADWNNFKARIKDGLKPKAKTEFVVGDIISFIGDKHYISANATMPSKCAPGEAKITAVAPGAKHPYHAVKTDGSASTVHGWVDAKFVKELEIETLAFRVGDVVNFIGDKHFKSSTSAISRPCKPGEAKISAIVNGAKHPYHLIAIPGGASNVYGWVDAGTIKEKEPIKPVPVDTTIDTIEEVQKWLNDEYNADLEVDGGYGPLTQAALIEVLQRGLGVDVDGGYGPQTHSAVRNLYVGDYGKEVEALQGLLVCNGYKDAYVDGGFGNDTKRAVLAYQRANGLYADGVAGKETFDSLCDY